MSTALTLYNVEEHLVALRTGASKSRSATRWKRHEAA